MSPKRKYDDFRRGLGSLLSTGDFSDFIITCGGKSWNVHKAIICTQSEMFGAASRFGKEAAEGKLNFPDEEPDIVGYILEYMYEGDYLLKSGPENVEERWMRMIWDAEEIEVKQESDLGLYGHDHWIYRASRLNFEILERSGWEEHGGPIGEEYHASPFYLKCEEHADALEKMLQLCPTTAEVSPHPALAELLGHAKIYTAADKYLIQDLKNVAKQKFQDTIRHYYVFACNKFYDTIREVLEVIPGHDTALRDMIFERVYHERKIYGTNKHPALRAVLKDIPGLCYYVLCKEEDEKGSWSPKANLWDMDNHYRWNDMIAEYD